MKVYLIPNMSKSQAIPVAKRAIEILTALGVEVVLPPQARLDENSHCMPPAQAYEEADVVLTVGGDGTILHAARAGLVYHKPIMGVNLGRTGFLATCEVDQLDEKLRLLVEGKYQLDDRMMLDIRVPGYGAWNSMALNDVAVYSSDRRKATRYDIYCDGLKVNHFRGDGVVVSTPTGSTGYSLSAGGPILDAHISGLIVTPICAHSIHVPPIVFSAERRLTICAQPEGNENICFFCDGANEQVLPAGASVEITRARHSIQLIEFQAGDQFRAIDEKLRGR